MLARGRFVSEAGFSLAEILVTIAIVGITFTAILTGMLVSITVSSLHRKEATADTVVRSAAEWIKDGARTPYQECAGTGAYSLAGLTGAAGYAVSVTRVEYWNGSLPSGGAYTPTFQSSCPSPDAGLQRITIAASTSEGVTETVQILKRLST